MYPNLLAAVSRNPWQAISTRVRAILGKGKLCPTPRRLETVMLVVVCIGFPQLAQAQYTEKFETWSPTSMDSWQTKDLSGAPFNVPANAVVEVMIRNQSWIFSLFGGVRAVGSSLDRRLDIDAPVTSGEATLVMHVQADSSSNIQYYSEEIIFFGSYTVDFVLLGYWTSGTYVERFDTFTAEVDATWTDKNLCSYGLGANNVGEIVMTNDSSTNGRSVGVRTNGSAVARRFTLDVDGGWGGECLATMMVKTDTSPGSTIEVYAENDTDTDFYLVGYWSVAPGAYTETFTDVGSPSASTTWENKDLTANGVPDDAIAEFVLANEYTSDGRQIGVRANGSSLSRLVDPHAVVSGNAAVGRMHVTTDNTATIEFYVEDITHAHSIYLAGYWDTCDTSIEYVVSDLGAVTAANGSLGWHINSTENVAGFEEDAGGNPDAWQMDCGTFTTLGVLGGSDAEAHGINDSSMVVGWSDNGSGSRRAYTWTSGGGLTNLGTAGGRSDSEAVAVNGSSEVVGTVLDFAVSPPKNRLAFIYLPLDAYTLTAGMNTLGTLGGTQSVGMDIDDSGVVVGGAQNGSGNWRPFRWASGTMSNLGTLGGESARPDHRAEAINGLGDICGRSYTAGGAKHAFFYDGSMVDLGVMTGGTESWAFGLNDSGAVVGVSDVTGSVFRAFVWDITNGLRNLNNLIPTGTGWTLIRATDINNDGFITGWGTNGSGDNRAFLLTPSCSGGGGAAKSFAVLASGSGFTDSDGAFYGEIIDSEGEPLGEVELLTPEAGIRIDYEILDPKPIPEGVPLDNSRIREGFGDDLYLTRTLSVATTAIQVGSALMVSMTFTQGEIAELGAIPGELELHVSGDAAGGPVDVWTPAGEDIGESEPTTFVGDSGFVEYSDGTVAYWAVRALGGTFAVGMPAARVEAPTPPVQTPRPCGIAMLQPLLLVWAGISFLRAARRKP